VTADAVDEGPPKELSLQKIRSLWQSIRTRAEEVRPSLNAPLSRATLEDLDGTTLVIRVPTPPLADVVKSNLATLVSAIEKVTGRALSVRVVGGSGAVPHGSDAGAARGGEPVSDGEAGLLDYALKTLPSST
jgi:hypothetical protein